MSRHRILSSGLVTGLALTLAALLLAGLSFAWTPYDPIGMDVAMRLNPPSWQHLLGTDAYGRDVLSMIMAGARNSLFVALIAVGLGLAAGVPLGLLAAARGGGVDELVMRGNDLIFAFPSLLLAVMITAILGPGAVNAMVAIGIFNIPIFARVARGAALSIWTRDYILAARTAGKGLFRISLEHVLPNLASVLVVQATIQFALAIVAEAGLSYVGLGVQPPAPSWGRMLSEAQTLIGQAPWLALFPGLAIVLTVLGLSLIGDGMRDLLDPRLRKGKP